MVKLILPWRFYSTNLFMDLQNCVTSIIGNRNRSETAQMFLGSSYKSKFSY